VEFRILGPLEVSHAGSPVPVGGPRHRALLTVLLVHADEVVSTERLIQALWGDEAPNSASAIVHVRVSELRKALRAGRPDRDAGLLTRGSGYVLQVGVDALDARCFERLVAAGRQALAGGDHESASANLREALALWRGPALVDFADEPFVQVETARLEALRVQALEDRLEADLAVGRHGDVVVELEGLVAEHPLRERLWCQLMLALYRAGRQGQALRTYQAARQILVERLGIDPGPELQRLQTAILRHDPALELRTPAERRPSGEPPSNLPVPLTSFIGREWELAEVRVLLRGSRLVTLTGVGGAGKSRLALEVATTCLADHADGTWLVELAPLAQPDLVAHVVAAILGVREHPERPLLDLLAEHLRAARALLVLDNCEHLVDEVARFVQRLLESCTHLRILATSRERLGIIGEVLRPISGLSVPEPCAGSPGAVGHSDAARLFVERAAAVQPGFHLSDATAAMVAQICQRLDGLPLAIELAAARVNALGVDQIASRLDDRFRLLTQGSRTALPRHQTLRAVVDWSYGLLGDAERRLFDRLAVFVGGHAMEAAQAVCADPGGGGERVADLVTRLVDKSLVTSEASGRTTRRYRMLETLRAYGLERLDERGETARLRNRHAAYFLALAEPAGAALRGHEQPIWLERLETEHGNLRAALTWSVEHGDAATAVRLAGSLYQLWDLHGHYTEGRQWLARVLALEGPVPPAARARALLGTATLAVIQGDLQAAASACERAAALCRQAGDRAGLAHALQYLGFGAIFAGELDRAVMLLEESLRNARAVGDRWVEGWSLVFLATAALAHAEPNQAVRLAAECEAVLGPVGDREGLAWALLIRGTAAWRKGDPVDAAASLREGLRAFQRLGGLWGLSLGLFMTAQLAGAHGDHQGLTTLLSASEALRQSVGAGLLPFIEAWSDAAVAKARAALGRNSFEQAWDAGQALSPDTAIVLAMRELDSAEQSSPAIS
jgi:predicted ATPase/DNA-binding SARP family transcriptional activator